MFVVSTPSAGPHGPGLRRAESVGLFFSPLDSRPTNSDMPASAKQGSRTTALVHFVRVFNWISKCIIAFAAISMCAVSVALVIASFMKVAVAFSSMPAIQSELLESVSLVVISVAIIDIARYILEEKVLRDRELREAAEAREAITKFIVVVGLVIAIESIVFIFNLGRSEPERLIFPALLLLIFVGMVVGLGLYQKLSLHAERQLQRMRRPASEGQDDG